MRALRFGGSGRAFDGWHYSDATPADERTTVFLLTSRERAMGQRTHLEARMTAAGQCD
jgi:hypothetical protein